MQSLLVLLLLAAQLDKPPEFSTTPAFKKSEVDTAIDSAAHTSGQKSESAKWMVRSLAEWPRSLSDAENASWQTSMALLARGALADAASSFEKGAREFPGNPRQAVGQAVTVYAQGNYQAAAATLLAVARRHPRELRLLRYLVEVRDAGPSVAAALKAWAQAYPKSAEAQWAYGTALMEVAPSLAVQRLEESVKLSRGQDARPLLALAKLAAGDPKRAVAYLTAAIAAEPQNAEAHYRLAMAYQQAGNPAKAAEHMNKYKSLKP